MGHFRPAKINDIAFGRRRHACAENDQCLDRLTPLRVGDANHAALGDRRMLEQAVLHFNGAHVLAARDDHVLLAISNHHVRIVEVTAITGMEVPVLDGFGRLFRLFPVSFKNDIATCTYFSVFGDLHRHTERRSPGASQQLRAVFHTEVVVLGTLSIHREQW